MSTPLLDEIFALNSQVTQRYSPTDRQGLYTKLKALSPAEGQTLRDRCLASGIPEHLTLLALCHRIGSGVALDPAKAVELFQRASDLGDSNAMHGLGISLQKGIGIAKDEAKAVEWYRKSADLGNPMAMNELGYCLKKGIGLPKDETKGVEWYQKSADLGNPIAMSNLGKSLMDGAGIAKDETKGVEWFRRSADLGDPKAMNALGKCLLDGVGIPKDEESAIEWLRRAKIGPSYWRLGELFEKRHPRAVALRYFYKAWAYYPKGPNKERCRKRIEFHLRSPHPRIQIVRQWSEMADETDALRTENARLKAENEALRTELDHRPGGGGFDWARRDFEAMASVDVVQI